MRELTDPKIKVSREVGKQIAQIICKEIKTSIAENAKIYDRAKRNEQMYAQMTKWDVKGMECDVPWEGASNYFIGLVEWTVDAVWARLMNILFGQPEYMVARGVESTDIDKEDAVTDFTRMTLKEKVKLYENSNFFFKQLLKLPFAVLKFCWVQEYDRQIIKEQGIVFQDAEGNEEHILQSDPNLQIRQTELLLNGYKPVGQQDYWVSQDIELANGPQLKYINLSDYVWQPKAKKGIRPYWEGDRFWLTINEMQNKVNAEQFIKESVDIIKTMRRDGSKQGIDAIISEREDPLECFHWYGRLPFNKDNQIDFQDTDAIEQEVYCVIAYEREELLEIDHWYYTRKPWPDRVYIRECFEETEDFSGRCIADKLFKTQQELNDLHKTLMDNAWLAMQKIFVKKRSLTGEDWEEPEIYPGAFLEVDQAGDIEVLNVGDIKAIGIELETILLGYAERLSNITNWNLGTTKQQGGKATATEFMGVMQEGNIGREPFLQRCYNVLKKICQWNYSYYYERMPEGLERKILGENGEPLFPTQQNMPLYAQRGINPTWRQEDIAGQFDYEWLGTSQNENRQWNLLVANDLMDRYLPQPMVGQNMLATWEILREGLISRGKRELVDKILPKKTAILAEMKNQQMQSELNQHVETQLGAQGVVDPIMKEMVMAKVKSKVQGVGLTLGNMGGGNVGLV